MIKKGIFRKRKIYMPYNMIQDIDVSQGLYREAFPCRGILKSTGDMNTLRWYWKMYPIRIRWIIP